MQTGIVNPPEATTANADLWTRYFQDQWSRFLNPLGGPAQDNVSEIAEGTAARVASFLTLVAAGPIAWMYNANAPSVMTPTDDEAERPARAVAAA